EGLPVYQAGVLSQRDREGREDPGGRMTLIERIEAATRPDRELDAEIAVAKGWRKLPEANWFTPPNLTVLHHKSDLPDFTASIDAALTLVPEGWFTFFVAQDRHSGSWVWHLWGGYGVTRRSRSPEAALAICAAALKAREAALAMEAGTGETRRGSTAKPR